MKEKTHVKSLKPTLASLLVVLITLGFVVSTVSAWDWPDSDDLDDWWDDVEDWWEDKEEEAEEWFEDKKDDVEDWWDDAEEEAEDWCEDAKDRAKDTGDEVYGLVNEFQEAIEQDLDRAIDIASKLADSSYVAEAWNEISSEKERLFCEEYSDPKKVDALERRRGVLTEGTIIAIKLVPVYDPEQKRVCTFSGFARGMVDSNPALEGSDLAEDPVRCATLMLLDSDYLEYAKIIQTTDGKWVSMKEALAIGYKTREVQTARSEYIHAKSAYNSGDPGLVESHMKIFCSKIQEINSSQKLAFDPLWLLPIGLIVGVAGMLVYGRKKSKEEIE